MFSEAGLGLVLVLIGLGVPILVWIFLRLLPQRKPSAAAIFPPPGSSEESHSAEAVIVVQLGGRVEYISRLAGEWFGLQEGELPDLERLARRVRPSEDFLELCAS